MRGWLKLVGTVERQIPEAWGIERKDLLREVRFSEVHPPDPISRGDRLVYHAVGHQRMVAVVEVLDDEPTRDSSPSLWEKQWPLILNVRPLLKIGRVSRSPSTDLLGDLCNLAHQGFVPLTDRQLRQAEALLREAGAT
jgi:hypothetical protein